STRLLTSLSRSYSTHPSHAGHRHQTTAFIGLGRMGHEMAFNLFSRTLVESGGSAHFVCDVVRNNFHHHFPGAKIEVVTFQLIQTVVTMLPSSPHVQKVYASEAGGIIPALHSKGGHKLGATMVDAPVSGGVAGAKAGTLSFLVGGTEPAFDRVSPILSRMGKRIMYCGPSGAGLARRYEQHEAMLLGQKLGLEPAVLADVINNSTGACWASSVNNPVPGALPDKEPPCTRDFEGGFATSLMLKDMGLATEVGDLVGCSLPMGEAAERIYAEVIEAEPELANKDFSSVYRYLRISADEESRK
ncbi:6-phosphogluconate dehydrogenase, partial [Irpex lacteus]